LLLPLLLNFISYLTLELFNLFMVRLDARRNRIVDAGLEKTLALAYHKQKILY
jgi:hypothetical protein